MGKNHKGPVGVNIAKGQNAMQRLEARLRAEYDVKQQFTTDFLLQVCCDAFLLAASDVFQCGAGRAWKAIEAYRKYVNQIMDNLIDDSRRKNGNGDNELLFFWTDLDRRLEQIVGKEKFTPHDERYDETGMKLFEGLFQRYMGRRILALKEAEKVRADKEEPEEGGVKVEKNICFTCKHFSEYPVCPAANDDIIFASNGDTIVSCKAYEETEGGGEDG